ncbi:hypothetical protein Marpi_2133 (plasmid) [Marinitoga piezophila KA3]|uniref:Uncharacterized protein n=1 Tax=Marinitoga piezophila (strain DSM 14283 / JCM 11233 / KA3) TaxID=443254 RepID=H2J8G2_MARPK|nr:hypothetical protein [Marinitoga piezophila]AEX86506.1 hypothetical protein Marpi_2133 [Marinitoga piezophila KA3]
MKKGLLLIALLLFATVFFGNITIGNPVFENQHIKVTFNIKTIDFVIKTIGIKIENKTDKPVKILWDEVLFTDNKGEASGVIHSGVKYINMDRPQVPSVIPPNGSIDDVIIPKSHIYYYNGWKKISINKTPSERYFFITYEFDNEKYNLDGTLLLKEQKSNINWGLILGVLGVMWLIGTLASPQ